MAKETLSKKAYDQIKEKLQDGTLQGYLNGRQIADDLGMGYTPIREAFLQLQNEGLIQRVDNVGYFVSQVDFESLVSIFQVRECIELYVWEQAFDLIAEADIQHMREIHEKEIQYIHEGKTKEFVKCDIELHMAILKIFGNEDLENMYYNVRQRYLLCPVKTVREANIDAVQEHENWIKCIEAHDKEGTLACLREHIDHTKRRMREGYISIYK